MKKLLSLAAAAVLLTAVTATSAFAAADTVFYAAKGTATIDGVKDAAYDAATAINLNTTDDLATDDGTEGVAYIIADDTNIYVFVSVKDSAVDSTSATTYERDSLEVFTTMDGTTIEQSRIFAEGDAHELKDGLEAVSVKTDAGYDVEVKVPLANTNVSDGKLAFCLQLNAASEGKRNMTVHAEGNSDGYTAWTNAESYFTLSLDGSDVTVDNTGTAPETGASAALALAVVSAAGAVIVASKKK